MISHVDSQTNPQTPDGDGSLTPEQTLAKARRTARESGLSPNERSAQKIAAALYHLYRFEWASPATVGRVARDNRHGYAQQLKRAGLVCITEIPGSPGTLERPRFGVTLTSMGVERAMETLTDEWQLRSSVKTGPRAIPMHQIEHDHGLQLLVLYWLEAGTITDYLTPADLRARSQPGEKQPDLIVWGGRIIGKRAVELEITAKSTSSAQKFIYDCVSGIREQRWADVLIMCRSAAVEARYRRLIDALRPADQRGLTVSRG